VSGAWVLALAVATAVGDAAAAGPALPEGTARYRMLLGGETVGLAELSVACEAATARCLLRWETRLRLPAEAGGGERTRRVLVPVRRDGPATDRPRLTMDGLSAPGAALPSGAVPASAVELLLSQGEARCVPAGDEETGSSGPACAVRGGGSSLPRTITFLGVAEEVWPGADGFPERVDVPAQRVAYLRDPGAGVPARVDFTVRVRGPADAARARRFCALRPDPVSSPEGRQALPPVRKSGEGCQAQAAAYAEAARRRGLATRIAVGVAHDGAGFVWHAWAEVETPAGWVAVDPAFGQAPARGPRFTVARHGEDAATRREAGRRILECWGARVE
jgi:hypothetical protein